jgi:purine-binding chemotaxis protein CheW
MGTTQQFCSFFVDGLCFGIEVEWVQEIRNMTSMTRVPLAARAIGGLLNLRGNILTAIDMRRCLEVTALPADQPPVNIVLRTAEGDVCLLVDRMGDVLDVDADDFELPPRTLSARSRELIRGAYHLDERLMMVLNLESILNGTGGGVFDQPGSIPSHVESNREFASIGVM